MKLTAVLLLVVGLAHSTHAQTAAGKTVESVAARRTSGAELQLATSIVEQKYYCSNMVGFKLRIDFRNVGTEPVVLDKRSFVVRRLVSRDLEAAAAKQYEEVGRFDLFDGAYLLADPADASHFVVLKPGESYSLTDGIGSFAIHEGEKELLKGRLTPGTHHLQLEVTTWTYLADPTPFQKKWKGKGFLWTTGLTSLPMPFTIEKDRVAAKCP